MSVWSRPNVNNPSPEQMDRARRLLAHEGAGRVYDKLHAHLAPLVGAAGVQALLARSAKLAQGEFACLSVAVVEDSTRLRDCLRSQDPTVAAESAAALFATFFALITVFIGERLTTQVLRTAWPTIEELARTENEK